MLNNGSGHISILRINIDLTNFLQARGFDVETFPNPVHLHLGYLRAQRKIMKGDL